MDYDGNGYRKWIPVAATDGLLLDAILSVAKAHLSRWQRRRECMVESRVHYNDAIKQLRDRLHDTALVRTEATLAAMMFLIPYEVSLIGAAI